MTMFCQGSSQGTELWVNLGYRQSRGGNYLISAEQVINSLKLQRIKLFSKLDIQVENDDIVNGCCTFDLKDSEQDLEIIEACFEGASALAGLSKSQVRDHHAPRSSLFSRGARSII